MYVELNIEKSRVYKTIRSKQVQTQTLKPSRGGLEQLVTNFSSWLRWTSVKFSTTYDNSGEYV
jgi:hypothetical protein